MCFNGDVKYLLNLIIFFFSVSLKNFVYSETFSSGQNFFDDFEIQMGEKIECKIEASIGFDWENGKYVSKNFKATSYLFEKVEHQEVLKGGSNMICAAKVIRRKDAVYDSFSSLHRCYLIKREGVDVDSVEYCEEVYGENKKLLKVQCENQGYVFHPEQLILVSPGRFSKDPRKFTKFKDSFVVEHGSCRVMKY